MFGHYRCLVFAYGSGVFQQQGQQTKDNMTDFIFCVEVCLCLENSNSGGFFCTTLLNRIVKNGTRRTWPGTHHIMPPLQGLSHNWTYSEDIVQTGRRFLGPKRITAIQRFYGAKLYFNTLVPWGEGKIKYGVIDRCVKSTLWTKVMFES